MSADVDQEVYDDCTSVTAPKPQVMPVNELAAMFGGKVGSTSTGKPTVPVPKKPVAVVNPSKPGPGVNATKPGPVKVPLKTPPKPVAKPAVNGDTKAQNNSNSGTAGSDIKRGPSGKITIPGPFNKADEEDGSSKLIDFRKNLKSTGSKNSMTTLTVTKSPTASSTIVTKSPPPSASSVPKPLPKTTPQAKSGVTTAPSRSSVLISFDSVKYKLRHKPVVTGKAPKKPNKMPEVDFSEVTMPAPAVPKRPPPKTSPNSSADGSFGEVYDDIGNTETSRVSVIKEYSEEDELNDMGETYDDIGVSPPSLPSRTMPSKHSPSTTSPSVTSLNSTSSSKSPGSTSFSVSEGETYDDCVPGGDVVIGELEDVYEDVGEVQKNAALIAKKEEEKKKEQERKEKKEREKREKEEKEKQRKLEKEKKKEKEMLAKYNMTGNETTIAEGKAKENSKGSKLDLSVKKGDNLYIIRMTDNPQFRWLAKTPEGKVGYVESDNIEIMKENIKNDTMRAVSGVFEEVYDDVDTVGDPDQDIYEETG